MQGRLEYQVTSEFRCARPQTRFDQEDCARSVLEKVRFRTFHNSWKPLPQFVGPVSISEVCYVVHLSTTAWIVGGAQHRLRPPQIVAYGRRFARWPLAPCLTTPSNDDCFFISARVCGHPTETADASLELILNIAVLRVLSEFKKADPIRKRLHHLFLVAYSRWRCCLTNTSHTVRRTATAAVFASCNADNIRYSRPSCVSVVLKPEQRTSDGLSLRNVAPYREYLVRMLNKILSS